jgi:hypothetical protein
VNKFLMKKIVIISAMFSVVGAFCLLLSDAGAVDAWDCKAYREFFGNKVECEKACYKHEAGSKTCLTNCRICFSKFK